MDNELSRSQPHSIEAEQSVLGGILLDNTAQQKIAGLLRDSDFYRDDHQLIFRAMADMASEHKPIDVLTVSEWMKGRFVTTGHHPRSFFDIIGGLAYLGTLAKDTPSAANIVTYAMMVRNYALKREVIQLGSELVSQGFKEGCDERSLAKLLEFAVSRSFRLEQKKEAAKKGFISMKEGLKQQVTALKTMSQQDGKQLLGASCTLEKLDQHLSGFEKGKVYVLAGRPAMGKTTLGLNLVEGIAATTGGVVAVFSLEMSTDQIISKMMSSQGRVDFARLRNAWELTEQDWQKLDKGVNKLKAMDVYFDDDADQSPASIRARSRRLVRETGKPLAAILIDYVQLMHGSKTKAYVNREAEMSSISGEIRALAKDFECPVILLSQLNRSVENRPNKRPVMSDLRDSGALEQDASCIMFIYRDEVYHPKSRHKGIAELLIAKHRGGKTGTIRCAFVGHYQRFDNDVANDNSMEVMDESEAY